MSYTRSTVVDASPTGDSVKQAVLDLDADLSAAYNYINTIATSLALKLDSSARGATNGVASLDSTTKVPRSQLSGRAYDIGDIKPWPSEDLPDSGDWLECDGAELSIDDYNALYLVIGNTWGTADTSGNFVLPDARGKFFRGWDHSAGNDPNADSRTGGDHVGSTQSDQFKRHQHRIGYYNSTHATSGNEPQIDPWVGLGNLVVTFPEDTTVGGDETRPVNAAVMYVIRWR